MLNGQRHLFTERIDRLGRSLILPYLPLTLTCESSSVEATALLDTGASVNVLPYEIGVQLGALWENQSVSIPLSGNLAQSEARGLIVTATIAPFSPVLLAFSWTELRETPVILGHMIFLQSLMCVFIGMS